MPEVFIDGEKVEFVGESPGTIGHVLNLVQGVLSGRSRVVSSIQINGDDFREEQSDLVFGPGVRVDVESLTEGEALSRLAAASVVEIQAILAKGGLLCAEVLRVPWATARERCVALAEDCGAGVQNVSVLVQHCGAESACGLAAAGVNEALNEWIDAIGQGDAAAVCLSMDRTVLPAFEWLNKELTALMDEAS